MEGGGISHKFKAPAVRYEVAVSIKKGDIVWLHGPFDPEKWPDINIFRNALIYYLDENERVETDDGYWGEDPHHCKTPKKTFVSKEKARMAGITRQRHETVNRRFKQWKCMVERFRHGAVKHSWCFRSVAIFTQLAIEDGEPAFQVEYEDD